MLQVTGIIKGKRIFIRPLARADLELLMGRWNNGKVMASVGYPEGLGLTMQDMQILWQKWQKDPSAIRMIVSLTDGTPIGETAFHDYIPGGCEALVRGGETEIGLKICVPELWGQGYGTEVLRLMTDYAFEHLGVHRVLLNPSKTNARIIRVNEKCGYRTIGEKKGGLLMALKRKDWLRHQEHPRTFGR